MVAGGVRMSGMHLMRLTSRHLRLRHGGQRISPNPPRTALAVEVGAVAEVLEKIEMTMPMTCSARLRERERTPNQRDGPSTRRRAAIGQKAEVEVALLRQASEKVIILVRTMRWLAGELGVSPPPTMVLLLLQRGAQQPTAALHREVAMGCELVAEGKVPGTVPLLMRRSTARVHIVAELQARPTTTVLLPMGTVARMPHGRAAEVRVEAEAKATQTIARIRA